MFQNVENTTKLSGICTTKLKWVIVTSFVILGFIYSLPMFFSEGISVCDDTTFHLGRLVGLANVWSAPVNFDSFGNNGVMVNIFYPWLTMYPMWMIYRLLGSYVIAYKLYYMLLTVATLIIAYYSMHGMSKSNTGAFIFAVFYTFSSYRFADVYNRAALGESIALTFLPLVLLGIYKISYEKYTEWYKLAAGMTLLAYSHILSLFMSALFVGCVFFITPLARNDWKQRFIALSKAAILSVGLSLAMIIPMMEQYVKNDLFTPSGSGEKMAYSADSLATVLKHSVENIPTGRGIGLITVVIFVISCLMIVMRLVVNKDYCTNVDKFAMQLMGMGIIIVICATDILPWRFIGENTPFASIQFVWRLNAYSTLTFTAAFSLMISRMTGSLPRSIIIIILVVVCSFSGFQFYDLYVQNNKLSSSDVIMEADIATWSSGNVDYTPYQAKDYKEKNGRTMDYIFINGHKVKKTPTIYDNGSCYRQELGGSNENRIVDLPVFNFHGGSVLLNEEPVGTKVSERGTTLISIPKSKEAVVEISYKYTLLSRFAWAFSLTILIFYGVFIVKNRR